MKEFFKKNELFSRLLILFMFAILTISVVIVAITYKRSKDTYITSYRDSNQLLMKKVREDYDYMHENIDSIFQDLSKSATVEKYLSAKKDDGQVIINLNREMQETRFISSDIPSNLILLGKNGKTYFQNEGVRNVSIEELLSNDMIQQMNQSNNLTQLYPVKHGLTRGTYPYPGLLFIHVLKNQEETYGYAFIFVSENHLASVYDSLFDQQLHEILVVDNQTQEIVSANQKNRLGHHYEEKKNNDSFFSQIKLYSFGYTFYNQINEKELVKRMNIIQPMIAVTVISIVIVSILVLLTIRRLTNPIYKLVDELPEIIHGGFKNHVNLEGTNEVQELGRSYNLMLDRLDQYFNQVLETEREKRLAEIRSLQMQIQPHFIYNTLTSIKFLIWKNQNEKAVEGIDNFIVLLRHTLRNSNELVTLEDEMTGLMSYVEILRLRYGDNIQMNFLVSDEAKSCLVPKMIIQPVIENAYLYAFPNQEEGFIQLFATVMEENLVIEVMDNGIGFEASTTSLEKKDSRNYSGVGLKNIQERIQLHYGANYGITVNSQKEMGTTVTIKLPKEEAET